MRILMVGAIVVGGFASLGVGMLLRGGLGRIVSSGWAKFLGIFVGLSASMSGCGVAFVQDEPSSMLIFGLFFCGVMCAIGVGAAGGGSDE